ncbi:MAG: carboxypeptidase-like regulatory domain-containing protein, partial [Planctomycetota bacterium]
ARSVKLPELDTIASSESTSSSTSEEGRTASELERLLEIASLEAQWVSLATVGGVDEGANETVQAAHQRLAQETENYRNAGLDEERSHSANERLMNAYAKFGAALTVFYQSISRRILPNGKKTGTEVAVRALRMLDPRDAQPFESSSIAELRRNENLRSTLRWQSSRMRQAARYSDGTDEKTWWNASEEYQRLCLTIPGGEQLLNEPSGQFTINVTDRLNLEDRRRGESAVRLINATASNRSVVLSIDYPENLVAVSVSRSDENRTRIPFHTKRSMLGTKTLGPIAVNSGDSVELSIQFQRLGNASQSSQITIDLIDPSEDYEVAHANLVKSNLGSNSVLVELPVVELAAKATDATAISDAGGLDLNLFANRTNAIQFGVANQSSRTKRVRVAGYTFESNSQPPSFSNDSIENWTSERKPQVEFDVQAVAGNTSFGNPSAKPPAEKKQSDPTNASGKSKDAAGNPISGMLFSMTDLDTGEVTFRPVTFAIKRPRHFLRPSLRFDSRSNRILVDIAARDATMLPSDKPVRVDCGLAGVPTASTRGRLQGVVSRTSPSTALFINVPPDTYKTLRVLIHVDGYPRAFRYDVPCGVDSGEIEEINDRVDVEMTTDSRQGFLPAMEALPVQIKIDSPAGVFGGKGNELRYGLDTDDSGKPSPATVQSITTDRQVGVSLSESNQSGTVKLFASADDYLVELPTKRLENVELGIAAMLRLKGREQALPKIELFIDSSAPLVGPVRIVGSTRVLPKKTLRARVFGFDEASGVRRIEATVVKDDVTEFPADGEFIEALQTEPKHWELEVPVGEKVGGYAILVRAIDRVGNVSEPISQNFEVVSPKPTDSNSKPKLQSVAGQVIFRGQPFASAEVRVELDAKAIQVTQSDTTGTFKLSGLAPGKYQLIAKGLIQNRVRIAKQAVELKPDGTDPLRVPLMLR